MSKVSIISSILEGVQKEKFVYSHIMRFKQKTSKRFKVLFKQVYFLPKREIAPYDYIAESKDLPYERIAVLNKIILQEKSKEPIIIVTTLETAMQKMISKRRTL